MVINTPSDSYTFQNSIIPDSGQSSEDGSGMHSPVFASGNYPNHNGDFRYSQDHLDVQHPGMITPPYDYGHSLSTQQPPMLDTSLELPNSSARIPYSPHYSIPSRSHMDFHTHSPVSSRMTAGAPPMDLRYSQSSERRLPGVPAHDQSYTRPIDHSSMSTEDQRPSITTRVESPPTTPTAFASSNPVRKEMSVVIACHQCRARKIRCDSTRPKCTNCARRSNDCEYDDKPRRRGPDKRPGTRQRSCKKRPTDSSDPLSKRKKATTDLPSEKREDLPAKTGDELEPSLNSRTLDDRYSSKFYHSNVHPTMHPHARISEPNSHLKHELPYRRPSSYVYDQGPYTNSKGNPGCCSMTRGLGGGVMSDSLKKNF